MYVHMSLWSIRYFVKETYYISLPPPVESYINVSMLPIAV